MVFRKNEIFTCKQSCQYFERVYLSQTLECFSGNVDKEMKIIPIEFARKLDPNVSYDQANAGNEDYVTDDDYFGIVELSLSAEGTEQSFVSIGEDCYGATKRGKGDFTYVIAPSEVYYVNIRFGLGDSDDHLAG